MAKKVKQTRASTTAATPATSVQPPDGMSISRDCDAAAQNRVAAGPTVYATAVAQHTAEHIVGDKAGPAADHHGNGAARSGQHQNGKRGAADHNGEAADAAQKPLVTTVALSHDFQRAHVARTSPPAGATVVTTYKGLNELVHAFAAGHIPLLVIVARPGLGKSRLVQQAVENQKALIIKLRKSGLDFYTDLYAAKDLPVVLDDADNLISQPLCREYVKALTETDQYKRLSYGTKTKILEEENVPKFFFTTSPVCLIANRWNSRDAIFHALESRAEFSYFDPDWSEVYREVGGWFWDEEIYDYVWERLGDLKEPDMRLFVKAHNRKRAGLSTMNWRKLIDDYLDDALGLEVRRLMDDPSFKSNTDRAQAFTERTKANRATFYRRLAQIKRYRPQAMPGRIILKHSAPPVEARPADGEVPG